jgi:hypothetical protein
MVLSRKSALPPGPLTCVAGQHECTSVESAFLRPQPGFGRSINRRVGQPEFLMCNVPLVDARRIMRDH